MHLVEVAFKGNRKEFYAWEGEEPPAVRASVVVEADRGEDLGIVHATGEYAQKRCQGCSHGLGAAEPTRKALRVALARDLKQAREIRAQDDDARRKASERVKVHGLVMKLSDAEWQWDRKKLTFYFTADRRVDFRDLVRDLAALFRARIELKQIGVRDEAKRLDGVGRCGRQFCSASWLPELRPVNLGVAKDQHLSLNPSQISGACGRLMCCLRYEHELYVESRKRFPKEGKTLVTAKGEEKVVANEIFNERVTLRSSEGEIRIVSLALLRRELAATGHPLPGTDASASPSDLETGEFEQDPESGGPAGLDDDEVLDPELDGAGQSSRGTRHAWTGRTPTPRTSPETPETDRRERIPQSRTRAPRAAPRREGRPDQRPEPTPRAAPTPAERPAELAALPETPAAEKPDGESSPRRRRGRRGGRRGRGKGGADGGAPPPTGGSDPGRSTSGGSGDGPPPSGAV